MAKAQENTSENAQKSPEQTQKEINSLKELLREGECKMNCVNHPVCPARPRGGGQDTQGENFYSVCGIRPSNIIFNC